MERWPPDDSDSSDDRGDNEALFAEILRHLEDFEHEELQSEAEVAAYLIARLDHDSAVKIAQLLRPGQDSQRRCLDVLADIDEIINKISSVTDSTPDTIRRSHDMVYLIARIANAKSTTMKENVHKADDLESILGYVVRSEVLTFADKKVYVDTLGQFFNKKYDLYNPIEYLNIHNMTEEIKNAEVLLMEQQRYLNEKISEAIDESCPEIDRESVNKDAYFSFRTRIMLLVMYGMPFDREGEEARQLGVAAVSVDAILATLDRKLGQ